MIIALGFAGVEPEAALIVSISFGLVVLGAALPGGLIWLLTGNRHA